MSSKTYLVALIIAIGLLLFTTSMAYRQIIRMQESAEMVAQTLRVYNAIGDLTTHYSKADSEEFRKELLNKGASSNTLENYKLEGTTVINNLESLTGNNEPQRAHIKPLKSLLNKLYGQLTELDSISYTTNKLPFDIRKTQKSKINNTLYNIRSIKNRMLDQEEYLMEEREASYKSDKSTTPITLLLLAFFALLVFIVSFYRIYLNKLKVHESEAFLQSVLDTTDNIVNYFEPIFDPDKDKHIADFKIVFANLCNRDYLGLEPDEIMGKTVLDIFPFFTNNGGFEEFTKSYNEKEKVDFDREVVIDGEKMWFHIFVTPLLEGVLFTARNSTAEEKAKEAQFLFKKRLEKQNLELLDNKALLNNIFKSISHIVMHFKSIRGKDDAIIDFEILFVNDRISPISGDIPDEIKNKKVSEIFPNIFKNGVFEHLVSAIENEDPVNYEVPYYKNGFEQWFKATAIKLGDGVTITTIDITEDKKKSNQLKQLNEALSIQNTIFADAEVIAKTGSYVWHIDTDVSELSDNFFRMLGCEPHEFEASFKRYRDFVHPDDLELYDYRGAQITKYEKVEEHTYRIITKQGDTKHFKSNGQFIEKNGETVMIGVVQDVTDIVEAEKKLVKRNLELKRSNAELESFNRVASHDLQEPLRKIQLFVSRIEDREGDQFSEKGRVYFDKVRKAVTRMQSLITNLLAYSRIDSTKKDFERINLNLVLDKVKEDLTNSINETNTIIIADKLPKIKGIVFQMEQLFTNLLSNAIKYKSTDAPPKVKIVYEKAPESELPKHIIKVSKVYHKISFIDNGIGFEPIHATKIFEVFQRLHQKTEYSGTGIGLAICEKIVENHNGYIYAKGELGVGAEFIIYLPA
ncbi:ATP-binding protein [Algibacter sp. 2305UL17-15]|uniref:ATP-binding protein n=1 Tax=Algibacter sp. 2305UL17-15 TaxID=3231268 RepID=UPI00345B1DC7